MLRTVSKAFLSLVFPLSCELCGTLLPAQGAGGVCQACRKTVRLIGPPHCTGCGRGVLKDGERCGRCLKENFNFDRAFACVYYDEKMKKLLHAFKFGRRRSLLPFFTGILGDFLEEHPSAFQWDMAVPVPMDPAHERERGFNQAALLSAALAKSSGKAHARRALGCRKSGTAQSSLKKSERRRNAEGRFFVPDPGAVGSRRVLLVDDILTTGQTASACAQALKSAGATSVTVLAFARGE